MRVCVRARARVCVCVYLLEGVNKLDHGVADIINFAKQLLVVDLFLCVCVCVCVRVCVLK